MIKTIDPKSLSVPEVHNILLGTVVPRPIALASTIDKAGNVNLSPFSYFNVFSANPPVLVFSPARRAKDNTTKHTLENVMEVAEVCISVVTKDMVQQVSLASTEYDKGVNEFVKSGLTEIPSEKIKPPRPAESPVSFECRVTEVKPLGEEGGAGNLIICEVLLIHMDDKILMEGGKIDPLKLNPVARLGGNYYSRLSIDTLFEVTKPLRTKGIGVDQLPQAIRESHVLTGSDLAILANIEELPDPKQIKSNLSPEELNDLEKMSAEAVHIKAQQHIQEGNANKAWAILLG